MKLQCCDRRVLFWFYRRLFRLLSELLGLLVYHHDISRLVQEPLNGRYAKTITSEHITGIAITTEDTFC